MNETKSHTKKSKTLSKTTRAKFSASKRIPVYLINWQMMVSRLARKCFRESNSIFRLERLKCPFINSESSIYRLRGRQQKMRNRLCFKLWQWMRWQGLGRRSNSFAVMSGLKVELKILRVGKDSSVLHFIVEVISATQSPLFPRKCTHTLRWVKLKRKKMSRIPFTLQHFARRALSHRRVCRVKGYQINEIPATTRSVKSLRSFEVVKEITAAIKRPAFFIIFPV